MNKEDAVNDKTNGVDVDVGGRPTTAAQIFRETQIALMRMLARFAEGLPGGMIHYTHIEQMADGIEKGTRS